MMTLRDHSVGLTSVEFDNGKQALERLREARDALRRGSFMRDADSVEEVIGHLEETFRISTILTDPVAAAESAIKNLGRGNLEEAVRELAHGLAAESRRRSE